MSVSPPVSTPSSPCQAPAAPPASNVLGSPTSLSINHTQQQTIHNIQNSNQANNTSNHMATPVHQSKASTSGTHPSPHHRNNSSSGVLSSKHWARRLDHAIHNSSSNRANELFNKNREAARQRAVEETQRRLGGVGEVVGERRETSHNSTTHAYAQKSNVERKPTIVHDWKPFNSNRNIDVFAAPTLENELEASLSRSSNSLQLNDIQPTSASNTPTRRNSKINEDKNQHNKQRRPSQSPPHGPQHFTFPSAVTSLLPLELLQSSPFSFEPKYRNIQYPFVLEIGRLINSNNYYLLISVFLTIFTLFAHDFSIAWLPKQADEPISIILCIIFSMFSLEIILNSCIRRNYIFSFLFLLDLIGTFSLIFDIEFISSSMLNVDRSAYSDYTSWSHYNITNHGDITSLKLNKSASILRVSRISRILRILRLIRVIKIFKFYGQRFHQLKKYQVKENNSNKDVYVAPPVSSEKSSRVGLHLSELIDKRVIIMLLSLLILVPILTADAEANISPTVGLQLLDRVSDSESSPQQHALVDAFILYHPKLLFLSKLSSTGIKVYNDSMASHSYLRDFEMESFVSSQWIALLNARSFYYEEAYYNMILTLCIIIIFLFGCVLISKDVHAIISTPLDRMSNLIRRLATTICFLSPDQDISEENEMEVIEGIIKKLSQIFQVIPDMSGLHNKAFTMLAGSKLTEIRTSDSVLSIEVIERPRESQDQIITKQDELEYQLDKHNVYVPNFEIFKELSSLDAILSNPVSLGYFKIYLKHNLLLENYLLFAEVDRFRSIIYAHASRLFNSFIAPSASTQVNIPAAQRIRLHERLNNPSADMFDSAQAECLQLMQGHYKIFINSKYGQIYMKKRIKARGLTASDTVSIHHVGGGPQATNSMKLESAMPVAPLSPMSRTQQARSPAASPKSPVSTLATRTTKASIELQPIKISEEESPQRAPLPSFIPSPSSKRHLDESSMDDDTKALVYPGYEAAKLENPSKFPHSQINFNYDAIKNRSSLVSKSSSPNVSLASPTSTDANPPSFDLSTMPNNSNNAANTQSADSSNNDKVDNQKHQDVYYHIPSVMHNSTSSNDNQSQLNKKEEKAKDDVNTPSSFPVPIAYNLPGSSSRSRSGSPASPATPLTPVTNTTNTATHSSTNPITLTLPARTNTQRLNQSRLGAAGSNVIGTPSSASSPMSAISPMKSPTILEEIQKLPNSTASSSKATSVFNPSKPATAVSALSSSALTSSSSNNPKSATSTSTAALPSRRPAPLSQQMKKNDPALELEAYRLEFPGGAPMEGVMDAEIADEVDRLMHPRSEEDRLQRPGRRASIQVTNSNQTQQNNLASLPLISKQ